MESFSVSVNNGNIEIIGIPDADSVYKIPKSLAKDLTDLSFHMVDLSISMESLNYILNNQNLNNSLVSESLWRSAIIHLVKCFTHQVTGGGNGSRAKLDESIIFLKLDPLALESFKYFKALRNKHIVHDENSYLQCLPGVVLNDGSKNYQVEKIICANFLAVTLDQPNFNNLYNLVKATQDYVTNLFDDECAQLTSTFESYSKEKFEEMERLEFTIPTLQEMKKPRK